MAADNLISRRETVRKALLSSLLKSGTEPGLDASSRDDGWLNHVLDIVRENIQDPDFSMEDIASGMSVSLSSFQRKIKGLTGLTPLEFVRLIRLKRAAELLKTGDYRINEVAYMVGFNKPSHFSALFKKRYGILPKDFVSHDKRLSDIQI